MVFQNGLENYLKKVVMRTLLLFLFFTLTSCMTTEVNPTRTSYEELCSGSSKCICPPKSDPPNVVDCNGHNKAEFFKDLKFPDGITTVYFQNNYFSVVHSDAFAGGSNVTHLDISHNRIKDIQPNAFAALVSLSILKLSNNAIWTLPVDGLKGLDKLRTLDLSHNSIKELFPHAFSGCPDLKELNLEYNPLSSLKVEMFSNLPKLQILNLKTLGLVSLPDKVFEHNKQLKVLMLDNNGLIEVPTVALQYLPTLKSLYLSGNQIEKITPGAFGGLENLSVLYLNHMKTLTTIEQYAFGNLSELEEFHCSDNPDLTYVDPLAFTSSSFKMNLSNLEIVSFREGGLDNLPEELLPYEKLQKLDLAQNPWYCDCNIRWMLSLQKNIKEEVSCAGPPKVENKFLSELSDPDMDCDGSSGYGTAIVVVSLALVVILVVLLISLLIKMYRKGMFGGKYSRVPVKRERDYVHYDPARAT